MKSIIVILFLLSLVPHSYSQVTKDTVNGNMRMEELPAVVIKKAGKDFSVYLPDRNADLKVRNLEDKFIAYDVGKDYEGYEEYLVIMETKDGSLNATYNENGKLTRVIENYKDVKLPSSVIYSIYKAYPGWQIVNDKYLYSQKEGDVLKKEYTIRIKKDKEIRKLIVNADGVITKDK
ncbi:hypothetical protein H4V97_002705 [Flavobacterium sp. CG_23.5]|uniref:hypothetical protein n=1 Tax=Flavobacterium sp. CG_23.5 TaxID=2760708 RepID=UPI001AE257FE|nr:hypothetical protein [Flavobacterium sp. CG_23.5]MBP2284387.1 hypothetical protein [Flavobacterium sp. CG_23.5]